MIVYVATIETKYAIVAVGRTADEARRLAGEKAHAWLVGERAAPIWPESTTVEEILDHFEPTVTKLAVGTAVFEGDEWVDEYLTNATKKLEETK